MGKKTNQGTLGINRQVAKEGNTDTSFANKQASRKTFYCFTLPNYDKYDYDEIIRQLKELSKKGMVGKEICPTTGTPHLQGFIALKKMMRITELKILGNPHFEACKGDEEQNLKYCSKEGNFIKWGYPRPIRVLEVLRPWQEEILTRYRTEPDDRTICWFWEPNGNIGKSAFIKYMIVKHKILFVSGGKRSDIFNLVFNQDMDECTAVFFNIPREDKGQISYAALESIKDGMICNTKYETGVKVFNSPHIFVFANFPPEKPELISKDRWIINELPSNELEL